MASAASSLGGAAVDLTASIGGAGGGEAGDTAKDGEWRKGGKGLVLRRWAAAQPWKKSAAAVGSLCR
jgi:hypothetical protein